MVAPLLGLPLLLPPIGFVLTSTLLFAAAARTLDHDPARRRPRVAASLAIGLAFAAAVFWIFSRGLGVSLPATPGLGE
jgi:hypothetical protein